MQQDCLKDRVALVMGAGSSGPGWGNGKATAVTFARAGAKLICADINLTAAQETAEIIRGEGYEAIAVESNIAREADVIATVAAAIEAYGRIDILDNNVGIAVTGPLIETDEATWDKVMAINLKGAFLSMKHVIPHMRRQGGGSIINISSAAGIRTLGIDYPTYYASKAGLNHLTRATAIAHAKDHIRVNAILPGLMKTPMVAVSAGLAKSYGDGDIEEMWKKRAEQVPMGMMGDAWDIAKAALFLASDDSRYITGLELVVDGGLTLKIS